MKIKWTGIVKLVPVLLQCNQYDIILYYWWRALHITRKFNKRTWMVVSSWWTLPINCMAEVTVGFPVCIDQYLHWPLPIYVCISSEMQWCIFVQKEKIMYPLYMINLNWIPMFSCSCGVHLGPGRCHMHVKYQDSTLPIILIWYVVFRWTGRGGGV